METDGRAVGEADGRSRAALRERQLADIAEGLPARAAALSRLFLTRTSLPISRTEVAVLWRLSERPRRITQIAADAQVTQPAVTLLVNRLQERGWVQRGPDPTDRRAVLVRITAAGEAALAQLRAEYGDLLRHEMTMLDDGEVDTLAAAIRILDGLIERLGESPS